MSWGRPVMCNRRVAGFTLVEMIIAIVIISVGLAGVLTAFNITVKSSADPLVRKQMLSIAEEMMEEILLKPYAVSHATANAATPCGVAAASRVLFDDIFDYQNFETTSICDIDGGAVVGLGSYGVRVTFDDTAGLGGLTGSATAVRITVAVTHSGTDTFSLVGWRTNYAAP